MNSKKIESKRKSHGPGSERGGDPRKMPSRTINMGGREGKTRELVHNMPTLNFSLYSLN